ncbi:Ribosomal large subunit pseudouridine synthase C [hydrothermal vent metagenome]|uniref:Ribosomal large subunit pseudouridine synthase C n=1 Tax=hydrothermal vent metagenome TaxID=652676 RepID=A0A3B0Z0G2_9ZZZZ
MNTVNNSTKAEIRLIEVSDAESGQRIDNYLMKHLKGVPRSMIYRLLRKGSVRVNKKRKKPDYRIEAGDIVKIPPIRTAESTNIDIPAHQADKIRQCILYEDDVLMVLNKPAGLAVHGGSGLAWGLIELVRQTWPEHKSIELVHRLDRYTSGCLLLAKTRAALLDIQQQIQAHDLHKSYLAVTQGQWPRSEVKVETALRKNVIQGGERMVMVDPEGKEATSYFRTRQQFSTAALCEVEIVTGRTHQIRVHAASEGHALAGDQKYGDSEFNKQFKLVGLNRIFLHAHKISLRHPLSNKVMVVEAPLPVELRSVLHKLETISNDN